MNSSLSFKQAALTFCSHFLLILVDDFLLGPLPTWQVSFYPLSPKINIQFSTLACILCLKNWLREFVKRSKHISFKSHNLSTSLYTQTDVGHSWELKGYKLLAQQKRLHVPDDWTVLFWSTVMTKITHSPTLSIASLSCAVTLRTTSGLSWPGLPCADGAPTRGAASPGSLGLFNMAINSSWC